MPYLIAQAEKFTRKWFKKLLDNIQFLYAYSQLRL